MKNTLFRLISCVLFIVAMVSCQKSTKPKSFDDWIEDGHISITAKGGDQKSKTVLQANGDVYWSPNDSISVFYGPYNLGRFTSLNAVPANVTVFRSDDTFAYGSISGGSSLEFCGVNPYSSVNASDGNSLTFSVPSKQNAVAGSFEPGSFPSIAHSKNLELSFYNVCGGLKFKVLNSGITKVTFRGNNEEVLAGRVKADFDEDGYPHIAECLQGETQVCLNSKEGLTPGEWYYISLLPGVLSKGFTIELSNGKKTVSYVSENDTEVKRSVFGVLSDVDDGLEFDMDWKKCEFVHKSLLLAIPSCAFPSIIVHKEDGLMSEAKAKTYGNMECIQMFGNGPSPTAGISPLMSMMGITSVPFEITDYREKVDGVKTPYSTFISTPQLYGTVSGLGINSYYNGDELNVEASLYFKKADEYKVVVVLAQDESTYQISTNSGKNQSNMGSDAITRYVLTDILGDDVDVVSDNIVLYRGYRKTISDDKEKKALRVVVYILRPYGSNTVVSNGSFGSYYVDNAFSVLAGNEAQLPTVKKINSEIVDFEYGGTIEF